MTPSSDPGANPRVMPLRCQACSAGLPAASSDVAFRCPQCGRGWEIQGDRLIERPSVYVAPPANPAHAILYLPYWSFTISAVARPKRRLDEGVLGARDRAAAIKRAFMSAYSIYRPTYVGEWGLVYTRVQPEWETRSGHGPEAPGASLPSGDAAKIVEHYVLAEIDKVGDLGSLEASVQVMSPELWAIPCYDLGSSLRCPWTHGKLQAAALADLSEMRVVSEDRRA